MADQLFDGVHPSPGQLWRNIRTGDLLFIYKKNGQIEGVFGDGRKKADIEVMKIGSKTDGWKCVYNRHRVDDSGADTDAYEFRAL
ncbi:MAG: hypothetical protein OEW04_10735 [Nitrospirota bacterium]|nr:hypothetical protein [Nitrospirota bacterium]